MSHNKRTPRGERAWPAPPRPGFPRPRPRPRGNRSRATASRYPEGGGGRGDNNPAAGGRARSRGGAGGKGAAPSAKTARGGAPGRCRRAIGRRRPSGRRSLASAQIQSQGARGGVLAGRRRSRARASRRRGRRRCRPADRRTDGRAGGRGGRRWLEEPRGSASLPHAASPPLRSTRPARAPVRLRVSPPGDGKPPSRGGSKEAWSAPRIREAGMGEKGYPPRLPSHRPRVRVPWRLCGLQPWVKETGPFPKIGAGEGFHGKISTRGVLWTPGERLRVHPRRVGLEIGFQPTP